MIMLGFSVLGNTEQRQRTAPRGHISSGRQYSSSTDTILPGNTGSWRPYANPQVLVTLGMSKAEVLLKAGNPLQEEVVSQGTDGHLNQTIWTYVQTGHNASVTTLTFLGHKLARIDVKLNP
jgi:hypothetical protein